MTRGLRGSVVRILLLLGAAYVAAGILAWLFADRLIFRPHPAGYGRGAGVVMIPVAEGESVAARWLPDPAARFTILYSHGNAEDIGDLEPFLARLRTAGFSVLAYDYRGYGLSAAGPATERRAYQDEDAAYRYLTTALGVPPERVIIHGRSLGGGVASHLAARVPAAGLVPESTFTSAFRVAAPPLFPFDRFATAKRIPRITIPTIVIHGVDDRVVPVEHGRRLYAALRRPAGALWVEGAGHDDLVVVAGERYFVALRGFADSLAGERDRDGASGP